MPRKTRDMTLSLIIHDDLRALKSVRSWWRIAVTKQRIAAHREAARRVLNSI